MVTAKLINLNAVCRKYWSYFLKNTFGNIVSTFEIAQVNNLLPYSSMPGI
jgi:hypothetical protein